MADEFVGPYQIPRLVSDEQVARVSHSRALAAAINNGIAQAEEAAKAVAYDALELQAFDFGQAVAVRDATLANVAEVKQKVAELSQLFLDGTEAVNDEAVATYVSTVGTNTHSAVGEAVVFPAKVATGSAFRNDINEWWVDPVASSASDEGGAFTFKGTVGGPDESLPLYPVTSGGGPVVSAPIILSEWRAGYPARSVVAGIINADDHNVPAAVALPGRRRIAVWSGHYADNLTTFALSDRSGSLESMAIDMGNSVTFSRTGLTSYAQVFLDESRSTSALSRYWLLQRVRRGTAASGYTHGWTITEFSVNENVDTGGLSLISAGAEPGHGQRYFVRNASGLSYLSGHRDGNTLRFLWGAHPSGDGRLTTFEVNMASGLITGAGQNANIFFTPATANDGAIYDSDFSWDTPELTGERRRFFYRERDGYVWAKWNIGDEDNGRYYYTETEPGTEGEPAGYDGLRTTTTGYATTPHTSGHSYSAGFEAACFIRIPSAPSSTIDVMRKFGSSTTGAWYMRVNSNGQVSLAVSRTDQETTPWLYTFPTAVPGIFGGSNFLGLKITVIENENGNTRLRLYTSTNNGTTWNLHSQDSSGVLYPLRKNSSDPVTLGQGTAMGQVTFSRMWYSPSVGGTPVVDVDFLNGWTPYQGSHTDAAGANWSLVGNALVGSSTTGAPGDGTTLGVTHDLGVTGPRIGHGEAANYIPGACILTNANGAVRGVVTVHRDADAEESYVLLWKRTSAGEWVSTELDRTDAVLARPYAARGSRGPVALFVSVIRDYGQGDNEFVQYESDTLAYAV